MYTIHFVYIHPLLSPQISLNALPNLSLNVIFSVYNLQSLINVVHMCIVWDHSLEKRQLSGATSLEEKLAVLPLAATNYHKLLSYMLRAHVSWQLLLLMLTGLILGRSCARDQSFSDFMGIIV